MRISTRASSPALIASSGKGLMRPIHSVIEDKGGHVVVHVRHSLVTNEKGSRDYFLPFRENTKEYLERELDPDGQAIVKGLATIPGISRIGVGLYFFVVSTGPAFDWEEEIRPQVDALTKEVLGYQSKK